MVSGGQCQDGGHPRHSAAGEENTNLEAEANEHGETRLDTVMGSAFTYLKPFIFIMTDLPNKLVE